MPDRESSQARESRGEAERNREADQRRPDERGSREQSRQEVSTAGGITGLVLPNGNTAEIEVFNDGRLRIAVDGAYFVESVRSHSQTGRVEVQLLNAEEHVRNLYTQYAGQTTSGQYPHQPIPGGPPGSGYTPSEPRRG